MICKQTNVPQKHHLHGHTHTVSPVEGKKALIICPVLMIENPDSCLSTQASLDYKPRATLSATFFSYLLLLSKERNSTERLKELISRKPHKTMSIILQKILT